MRQKMTNPQHFVSDQFNDLISDLIKDHESKGIHFDQDAIQELKNSAVAYSRFYS
jgi:hypothetical protein